MWVIQLHWHWQIKTEHKPLQVLHSTFHIRAYTRDISEDDKLSNSRYENWRNPRKSTRERSVPGQKCYEAFLEDYLRRFNSHGMSLASVLKPSRDKLHTMDGPGRQNKHLCLTDNLEWIMRGIPQTWAGSPTLEPARTGGLPAIMEITAAIKLLILSNSS